MNEIMSDEVIIGQIFGEQVIEHGFDKAFKIMEVLKTMADAVEAKHGKCVEIVDAAKLMIRIKQLAEENPVARGTDT